MDEKLLDDVSIHSWIQSNNIKTETGDVLDFKNHLFLFDIYSDFSPKLVCYKAAQIGFTTMAVIKNFWVSKKKKMDTIYTNPSDSDSNQFVTGKVQRIIAQNPVLQTYVSETDNKRQKSVGDSMIYYRGTWGERAAISVSSDLNIFDEEDRSKQEVIQMYASRLQHSKYQWEWHFSNPSVEGNGVSRYWAKSDQKHWFITCGGCNTPQYLSWDLDNEENMSVDMKRECFVCKHCGKRLTKEERRVGEWIAKYEDKEFSGYWINLLMAPWVSAKQIIDYYETKSAEYFANFVLGLPYVGAGNQVTPETIYKNCTQDINNQERIVIGCDSGIKKHYVLGNKNGLYYYGVTENWNDIRKILRDNKTAIAVIDALPDITEPRKLQEEFRGRVFLCHYNRDRKTQQVIRWGKKDELGTVNVDRNRGIEMLIGEFDDERIPLQGTQDDWEEYYKHWGTLYKIVEEDALGVPTFKWESSTGNDHWAHATMYWRVGMDRFRNEGGKIFGADTVGAVVSRAILPNDKMGYKPRFEEPEKDYNNDWRKTL